MQIFRLEKPIMDKIEFIVNEKITAGEIPAGSKIKFLDYEPGEGFIGSKNIDGAIAVYSPGISFSEGSGSKTNEQESDSIIRVDSYGFGAPLKNPENEEEYFSSVREAQNRAQILITCGFIGIMDRREVAGSPTEGIEPSFDSGIDIGADKYPVSMQKFTPEGSMTTNRGLCIYRMEFRIKLEESAINEALGVAFDGSDSIDSETYNPGSGPEGEN